MTTGLAERPAGTIAVTLDQIELVKRTIASGATPQELQLYLYDCARQGVHPLDRLIHFTKRGGKYTPVTSIDFMRIRAADTNEYAGSDDAVFGGRVKGDDFTATVTVWRLVQGQRVPFTATARWSEYKPDAGTSGQGDVMWQKMPHTMLAKCAEALALRKGFPRQLAGLYAGEEMDQARHAAIVGDGRTHVDTETGEETPATDAPKPNTDGTGTVKSVKPSAEKKPATVTMEDGRAGTTFDKKIEAFAVEAAKEKFLVLPKFDSVTKGDRTYTNLVGLERVIEQKAETELPLDTEPVGGPEKILSVRKSKSAATNTEYYVIQTDRRMYRADLKDVALAAEAMRKAGELAIVAFEPKRIDNLPFNLITEFGKVPDAVLA